MAVHGAYSIARCFVDELEIDRVTRGQVGNELPVGRRDHPVCFGKGKTEEFARNTVPERAVVRFIEPPAQL